MSDWPDSKFDISQFNSLANNPFQTRDDVIDAVHTLFNPLLPLFSEGRARVQLDASGSSWDRAACDLEGFARPLFGIVPMVKGGGQFDHWELFRQGLNNGTDPNHPEYWDHARGMDQRHVEATAIGYALLVVPEHVWEPLDETARKNLAEWLIIGRNGPHLDNNHMFFRVIVDLGLNNVGVPVNDQMTEEYLEDLEELYMDDGWYRDGGSPGDARRIDYYNPFAMHYYSLIYAVYRPQDKERAQRFRERARLFAKHFIHWFADTGANVPFGRSLIYRHAVAAFWGALATAGEQPLPWGVMKGIYLRNLRWWAKQPITRFSDGLLTLGYAYPMFGVTEQYNSSGSPWWSMKAFAPLSLPADHPFWASEELPMPNRDEIHACSVSGTVLIHQPNHTILFPAGPTTSHLMRSVAEKYNKFAYSSRYGFSVESDERGYRLGVFDNMIAFSDDQKHYRVREYAETASLAGDILYCIWKPWEDVQVETWVIPSNPWHIRVHRIMSPRTLFTTEGGFAAPKTDRNKDQKLVDSSSAQVISVIGDMSGIRDFSRPSRAPRVNTPHGNTNVMFPRILIPQLVGKVEAGVPTTLSCAVLAGPDGAFLASTWANPPKIPPVSELSTLVAERGVVIDITKFWARKGRNNS
jgi:hypothetical protein